MTQHLFDQLLRLKQEHEEGEHEEPAAGCAYCPQRGVHRRRVLADVIRGWIHKTPLSKCSEDCDELMRECADWPMAYELAELINAELEYSGRIAGIVPVSEGINGDLAP